MESKLSLQEQNLKLLNFGRTAATFWSPGSAENSSMGSRMNYQLKTVRSMAYAFVIFRQSFWPLSTRDRPIHGMTTSGIRRENALSLDHRVTFAGTRLQTQSVELVWVYPYDSHERGIESKANLHYNVMNQGTLQGHRYDYIDRYRTGASDI